MRKGIYFHAVTSLEMSNRNLTRALGEVFRDEPSMALLRSGFGAKQRNRLMIAE